MVSLKFLFLKIGLSVCFETLKSLTPIFLAPGPPFSNVITVYTCGLYGAHSVIFPPKCKKNIFLNFKSIIIILLSAQQIKCILFHF